MEARRAPEYTLEVFADPTCVKDVVKAILHTIFFHRYFMTLKPITRDLFDTTLPAVDDVELEALIEQRVTSLVRSMQASSSSSFSSTSTAQSAVPSFGTITSSNNNNKTGTSTSTTTSGRGQLAVSFYERKRRKTYFFGKADEDICWETWMLDVTCANPRTDTEKVKVRRAMESSLQKAAFKVIGIVNRDRDHIPPITTTETNPFPYQIVIGAAAAAGRGLAVGAASPAVGGVVGAGAGGGHTVSSANPRIGIF